MKSHAVWTCVVAAVAAGWLAEPASAKQKTEEGVVNVVRRTKRSGKERRPQVWLVAKDYSRVRVRPWRFARTLVPFEGRVVRVRGRVRDKKNEKTGEAEERVLWARKLVSPEKHYVMTVVQRRLDGLVGYLGPRRNGAREGLALGPPYSLFGPGTDVLEAALPTSGPRLRVRLHGWIFPARAQGPAEVLVHAVEVSTNDYATVLRTAPLPKSLMAAYIQVKGQTLWASHVHRHWVYVREGYKKTKVAGWTTFDTLQIGEPVEAPKRSSGAIGGIPD